MTSPELPAQAERRVPPTFLRVFGLIDGAANALLLGAVLATAWNPVLIHRCNGLHGILIGISLTAGLVEKYLALRVKFDLALFDHFADPRSDLRELDRGLAKLFGDKAALADRSWESRIRGAVGLALRQGAAFIVQLLALALVGVSLAMC